MELVREHLHRGAKGHDLGAAGRCGPGRRRLLGWSMWNEARRQRELGPPQTIAQLCCWETPGSRSWVFNFPNDPQNQLTYSADVCLEFPLTVGSPSGSYWQNESQGHPERPQFRAPGAGRFSHTKFSILFGKIHTFSSLEIIPTSEFLKREMY